MSTELATINGTAGAVLEQVVIQGDLAKLKPEERVQYYRLVCESVGLNPFTRPFQYISLSGKLTLYATKDATEQLRKRDTVSVQLVGRDMHADVGVYVVTAQATLPSGRTDESVGAVSIGGLKGEALANAIMKAETKAKRRVTLSICGLGTIDESEVDSISDASRVEVDQETGEIRSVQTLARPAPPAAPPSGSQQSASQPATRRRAAPSPQQPQQSAPAAGSPMARVIRQMAAQAGLDDGEVAALASAHGYEGDLDAIGHDEANKVIASLRAAILNGTAPPERGDVESRELSDDELPF